MGKQANIKVRSGKNLRAKLKFTQRMYPWSSLKEEGDSFIASGVGVNVRALRVSASRFGLKKGVTVTVNEVEGGALVKHCGAR